LSCIKCDLVDDVFDPEHHDIRFGISCDNYADYFLVENGGVTVSPMFDLDRLKKATLTVNCILWAIDIYGLAGSTYLSMQIHDYNDNKPIILQSVFSFVIGQGNVFMCLIFYVKRNGSSDLTINVTSA